MFDTTHLSYAIIASKRSSGGICASTEIWGWVPVTVVYVHASFSVTFLYCFNNSSHAFAACFIIFDASGVPDFGPFINFIGDALRV